MIRLNQRQQAPLMDAVTTQSVNITLVVCRPPGAALNPEPWGRRKRPLRVRLPPAIQHPMRGDTGSPRCTKPCRYSLNLLASSLFFGVAELSHLKHQIEHPISTFINKHKQGLEPSWTLKA